MEGEMEAAVASIGATDIRQVMKSQGPIVNTVILRCRPSTSNSEEDSKPAAVETKEESNEDAEAPPTERVILKDLIEEMKIDTTPSKSKVSEVLGGPFTFLGQYEDEGIVLMIRNFPDDLEADLKEIYEQEEEDNEGEFSFAEQLSKNFNIKALKAVCFQRDIETENMTEKRELVQALVDYSKNLPPINEHQLQPPLHNARVRGDIVVMKVAETEEELDKDDNDDAGKEAQAPSVPSNDEFFLDYSKEAYIKFASRTDIPEHDIETEHSEDEEEEEEEEEEGEDSGAKMPGIDNGGEEEDDEEVDIEEIPEDDKSAMLNLVMNEVLRQFREENGRGPNTAELLDLRANIAKELGVEIAQEIDGDWDKMAKENSVPSARKIAFTKKPDMVREYVPDRNEYPSDNDEEDEEYDDHEDSENVARSLMGDYEEEDDDNDVHQPPTKRLKTSEEEDSEPAVASS